MTIERTTDVLKFQTCRWLDLCACDKPLCNTFSYLRSNTRKDAEPPDGDSLVFNRVDSIDTNPSYPEPDAPLSTRTSFLTILLVGVPLAVGTATVVVVAFNYYCHLC
uniref:Activin types I and II receptor domain-containing protein n=1 Tax=Ascaris lumbricoides TaxID=6252 RepID=A0A0M3HVE5_ASCLU